MNLPLQEEQKLKIASPQKVARLLEKAAQTGLPLLIRTLSHPNIAVKGRAKALPGPITACGFKVGNLSERGLEHLAKNSEGGLQVEFAFSSLKVMFYSSLSHFSVDDCTLTLPDYLLSIERRKNARFPVIGSQRAFVSIPGWKPALTDPGAPPFFESSANLAELLPIGDISLGGLSISERFPAICPYLSDTSFNRQMSLHLPMIQPIDTVVSIRWQRKTRDVITDLDGRSRIITSYRFGVQFADVGAELLSSLKMFIQVLAQAEAI